MPQLVSVNQSAFIAGRCVHDNFLLVQQTARQLHNLKLPRLLLKLDIAKAFDTISWPFLLEVLRHLGFGRRWCEWICILVSTASSRILLNGNPGPLVDHAHGLRQGDPASPLLFAIVIDTLNSLLQYAVRSGLLQRLTPRHAASSISMFADDVVIFCHPTTQDLTAIRELLRVFGEASGLRTNFLKCSATPIRCDDTVAEAVGSTLACVVTTFPIVYLGLPLSLRKTPTSTLLPLLDKLTKKLATWKAALLSRAERLALVRHVLSVMPVHILFAMAINPTILKRVHGIIRDFLWHGRKDANSSCCLVNWRRVCLPLEYGGLGVRDLHLTGISLRARWLWFQATDPDRPWHHLEVPCDAETSHLRVRPRAACSRPRRRRRVSDGLTQQAWIRDIHGSLGPVEVVQYIDLWRRLHGIQLSSTPDTISWKWSANGIYSANSCYKALFLGSTSPSAWRQIWKGWAPLSYKFFLWLASLDRCWTAERHARHGLAHDPECIFCSQELETIDHLLVGCVFSRITWHEILSWCQLVATPMLGSTPFFDGCLQATAASPGGLRRGLNSIIALTAWEIWKHRNAAIFDGVRPSTDELVQLIKDEARRWAKAGDKGLDRIIPVT
nr:uncharacterized protein LOC120967149 [Aegilops tauschii subsp. strangulata]